MKQLLVLFILNLFQHLMRTRNKFGLTLALLILHLASFAQGTLTWATYYGSAEFDYGYSTAVDGSGNVYLAGQTTSTNFIASAGGYQSTFGGSVDAYLVKFNSSGTTRIWATYYGGTGNETIKSVVVDGSNNVYVAGQTASTNFIASAGGHQSTYGGGTNDAFLVKFNSAGSRLWATYYGGTGQDYGKSVAIDVSDNVYLAGYTTSASNIASGGFQNTFGTSNDAFLVKFNSAGVRQWGTYYGDTQNDEGYSVAVDASGNNVYLAGSTQSTINIASGGYQNTVGGGYDAFLVKFDAAGTRLWATYYGGTGTDYGFLSAVDASGNIFLEGNTSSVSAIASGGHQNTYGGGGQDAFLVKFDAAGTTLLWATYYGGTGNEFGESVITDTPGNVYLAGWTNSTNAIASGGFQNTNGGSYDAFLVTFDASGIRQCATYYGGAGVDYGYSAALDGTGNVYLAGYTASTNFIASGGYDNTFGGIYDAFLAKFPSCGVVLPIELLSFTGYNEENKNILEWTTATENNNDYFIIERSSPIPTFPKGEGEWTAIGTVNGAGNSNSINNYQFIDQSPLPGGNKGVCYYRLKQVDYDGKYTYSNIINVIANETKQSVTIYPNPAKESLFLTVNNWRKEKNKIEIAIFDVLGREVYLLETDTHNSPFQIDISTLSKGMYFLKVRNGTQQTQIKFVKD